MQAEPIARPIAALDAERNRILAWLAQHGPAPMDAIPTARPLTALHTRAIARRLVRDGMVARVARPWTDEAPRLTITRLGRLALLGTGR